MERFIVYIEEEVKQLYETLPQEPVTNLTDVLKREYEAAEKYHALKSLITRRIKR